MSLDTSVNGVPVRFRGKYSSYMPPLAYTIYAAMRERHVEKMFVADLIRAIGDCEDAFPVRSTPYARYMRIARLLADPVQVNDCVLTQERDAGVSRYKKNARVYCRPGVLPETAGPQLVVGDPALLQRYSASCRPPQPYTPIHVGAGYAPGAPPGYVPAPAPSMAASTIDPTRLRALEDRLAAVERMLMDGAGPLPADATEAIARIETDFKRRTFDLGEQQIQLLQRLNRIDPPAPVAD